MNYDIFDKNISKKLRNFQSFNKSEPKFHISKQTRKYKQENISIDHSNYLKKYQEIIEKNKNTVKKKYETMKKKVKDDATKIKQLNSKMKNEIIKQEKIIVSRVFCVFPTKKQKQILNRYNEESIKIYNACVDEYNKNKEDFNTNYMKQKLIIFKRVYNGGIKPAPYDMLTDVIKDFCANIKSCKSNMEKKNIKKYEFDKRDSKKQKSWSMLIPKKTLSINGIFPKKLDKMTISHEGQKLIKKYGVNLDSRLIYDKCKDKYYIKMPILLNMKKVKNRGSICALDPGEKVFVTYYSTQDCGFIGEDMRNVLLKIRRKIQFYQRLQKKQEKIKGKKEIIQKKINKKFRKIKNIVKELHNKCALYLVRNYNKILVPEFKTQYMISRKKINDKIKKIFEEEKNKEKLREKLKKVGKERRLSKNVKFVLNQLSHYKFKQHLRTKCLEYGCEYIECTEEYTSKTCSNCGKLNEKINKRELDCISCKKKINRDVNGSKNILMKYLKSEKLV